MAVTLETIKKMTFVAKAEGVEAVRAQLDGIDRAQQSVAKSADRMRQANDNVAKSTLSAAKQFDTLERSVDPLARANARLAADQAKVARALNEGAIGADRAANVISLLARRHEEAIGSVNKHGDATGVNNIQMMEAVHVAKALTDEIIAGQDPMRALAMEGGRIAQIFSMGQNGVGGTLRAFGGMLAPVVLNPLTLIAVGIGAATLASMRWKEQTDALTVSLNGLGRVSGMTASGASIIAERAAAAANISGSTARGFAAQYLGAGVRGPAIEGAIGITRDFGRRLGLSDQEAGKTLASALADPAKGADDLARSFGLITYAQREEIKQLAAVGDKSGAASRLLAILADQIDKMKDPTTRWQKMLDNVARRVSDKLDKLAEEMEGPKSFKDAFSPLIEAQRKEREMRESEAQEREAELTRMRQDGAIAAREAAARTYAEREAIALDRARIETLRQTHDAVKADIAAENERVKLMAESARRAEDYAKQGRDQLSVAGMTPYEAGRQKLIMEARDLKEQTAPYYQASTEVTRFADVVAQAAGRIGRLITLSEWQGGGAGGDDLSRAREAIAAIESRGSGGYGAIGPRTARGDRAYGRYQVMGQNIPAWTRAALGYSLSTDEFLANHGAQDAVFNHQFGSSMARYGNMNDAASVWFTGRPLSRGAGARDVLGTSGSEYVRRFNSALGGSAAGAPANDNHATIDKGLSDRLKAYDIEQIDAKIKVFNEDIDRQKALLQAQADAFGKTTEETARAAKEQELLNQLQQQGVPITDQLRASVADAARRYGDLAQAQEDVALKQRKVIEAMDNVRSMGKEALGGLISDLRQGERAGDAFANALNRIADRLVSLALDRMFEGLLGESGKTGGGLAGGGFFNLIKGFFNFADGGVMTGRGPLPLRRYADGGIASSPQLAMFGEGSGPEAFVPLKDGGIPVHLRMAKQAANSNVPQQVVEPKTEVHIHGAPPGTQVKESQDSNGGRRMDVIIAEATAGSASNPMVRSAFRSASSITRR